MTKEELKKRNKAVDVVSYQLFKSSSSVAANYRSVCRGKSDADFLNKLKIVDEEADESLFWLEFIKGLEIECDKVRLEKLIQEANELVSIFSAGIKTIKEKNNIKN
ncbi:four helix bundle protein [Flavobacterium granuli]|uniref:Four helix bundle protein n=1 Tax=Flavobacterium granuli TaxID=280093 RepID=A0A1M5JYM9_9FLAO|nr:four helix bundle protein [Flavobacterium granuli]PRZ26104.1 four helix bundle protein [Flavobacterium granuli]SHG45651.1 four helix bundle protein [Flavobacterium granuli]